MSGLSLPCLASSPFIIRSLALRTAGWKSRFSRSTGIPPSPQLQRYITGLLEEYAGGIIRDDMDVLMKRMVDLIHRHYDENLKLETLADVFTL
ncbi:hypothetical protein ACFSQ7_16575 [Paenibacillus rhizoplanae]